MQQNRSGGGAGKGGKQPKVGTTNKPSEPEPKTSKQVNFKRFPESIASIII